MYLLTPSPMQCHLESPLGDPPPPSMWVTSFVNSPILNHMAEILQKLCYVLILEIGHGRPFE